MGIITLDFYKRKQKHLKRKKDSSITGHDNARLVRRNSITIPRNFLSEKSTSLIWKINFSNYKRTFTFGGRGKFTGDDASHLRSHFLKIKSSKGIFTFFEKNLIRKVKRIRGRNKKNNRKFRIYWLRISFSSFDLVRLV